MKKTNQYKKYPNRFVVIDLAILVKRVNQFNKKADRICEEVSSLEVEYARIGVLPKEIKIEELNKELAYLGFELIVLNTSINNHKVLSDAIIDYHKKSSSKQYWKPFVKWLSKNYKGYFLSINEFKQCLEHDDRYYPVS